ncbi:O-methyltransferase [Mycobacterium sp. OAE908]|uniref:TylF/MycF family methyltransferase n=1 Tax=Mycobacterium sp. OAE908 TaxID=2817899 RepID=UPI0034E2C0C0
MSKPSAERVGAVDVGDRYVDLLQSALIMSLWNAGDGALEQRIGGPLQVLATKVKTQIKRQLTMSQAERAAKLGARDDGRDWPRLAHTMIGRKRMENLRFCMEDVLANDVPGDFIETGVWRGGACIFMRGILAARGVTDRRVWVADSFAGLPPPNAAKYPADARGKLYDCAELAVPLETVKATFERYGLLDDNVRFLKGWFKDTLPSAPIERLAVARLDGDMYESTIDALTNLYPKLSPGGYLIVDDYGAVRACRRAVADYRAEYGIEDPIVAIDSSGVFWQKSG